MLEIFYPKRMRNSVRDLDFDEMYRRGIRGLIFDIDNTLVPHGAPATVEAVKLFRMMHRKGFRTCLVSNNRKGRVEPFARAVGSRCLWKAHKPLPSAMRRAMELLGTDRQSSVLIGDQLFTDIMCANLAGIPSVLVRPIDPHEEIQIVLKRIPERLLLALWIKRRKKQLKKRP